LNCIELSMGISQRRKCKLIIELRGRGYDGEKPGYL